MRGVREAAKLLRSSGLSYEIRPGSKHHHIRIEGKMVLAFAPVNGHRDLDKLKSAIRRAKEC